MSRTELADQYAQAPLIRTIVGADKGAGIGSANVTIAAGATAELTIPTVDQRGAPIGAPSFTLRMGWQQPAASTGALRVGVGANGGAAAPYMPEQLGPTNGGTDTLCQLIVERIVPADRNGAAQQVFVTNGTNAEITAAYTWEVPTLDWE